MSGETIVKNCQIIYPPAGQAGEYSPLAANPYKGCTKAAATGALIATFPLF